jgi:transcriptional regulator GlxA family with amidase domain
MRICVLALDDAFDTGLASIVDTFATANDLAGETRFQVSLIGVRARVHTHHGFAVPVAPPPRRPMHITRCISCSKGSSTTTSCCRRGGSAI